MSHADFKFDTDLAIDQGDLVLLSHEDALGQAIRDRLATFRGEWFLDLQFGPDYRKDILVKNPSVDTVSAILKDEILKTVDGVFTEFVITQEPKRRFTLTYTINTTDVVLSDTITI